MNLLETLLNGKDLSGINGLKTCLGYTTIRWRDKDSTLEECLEWLNEDNTSLQIWNGDNSTILKISGGEIIETEQCIER